jgi:hypothetical protein
MIKPIALILSLGILTAGCHNATVSEVATDAIDCAKQQQAGLSSSLGPSILQLLSGTIPGWEGILATLVSDVGAAAECAIKDVVDQGTAALGSGSGSAVVGQEAKSVVVVNGNAFMAKHKMHFVVDSEVPANLK